METIPMLAHTHGQPASPTRLGKEIMVFVERLEKQLALLQQVPVSAKFGGLQVTLTRTILLTRKLTGSSLVISLWINWP
jgi:adenylosuccinate lyase